MDQGDGRKRVLADDFLCDEPGLLTDVHLWGSWLGDQKGRDPQHPPEYPQRRPGGRRRFGSGQQVFPTGPSCCGRWTLGRDQFGEQLVAIVPEGEYFWDAPEGDPIKAGDTQVWEYTIEIDRDQAFLQRGTAEAPQVYWLDVSVELVEIGPANVQFGWKTRAWPQHYNDDAVIGPEPWRELRYPPGHPYSATGAESSIDLAFALTSITFLNGDFNQDGQLTVIDIDMLTAASAAGNHDPWYDVNVDQLVDVKNIRIWVKILKNTWIGDANVDGMFNSSDIVQVFVRGKYEKPVAAVWSEGDWDGNGLFDSSDLVAALRTAATKRDLHRCLRSVR